MINIDKFGNPIYPSRFKILLEQGSILLMQGYFESKKKLNLFCKQIPESWFYADMRGTEIVPIWEDTDPLFYWRFDDNVPFWKRRRLIEEEYNKLRSLNCPLRPSSEVHNSPECSIDNSNGSSFIDWGEGFFDWENGYCKLCKKDMQKEGFFCSKECEDKYDDLSKVPCGICGERFHENKLLEHHTNYNPDKEETILICYPCHTKVHFHKEKYPQLKKYQPEGTRKEMLERKNPNVILKCKLCDKEFTDKRRVFCSKECKNKFDFQEKEKKGIIHPKRSYYIDDNLRRLSKDWYKRK